MHDGARRGHTLSAQSAGRPRAADRGDGRDGRVGRRRAVRHVRGAAPFAELTARVFDGVLDMLSGRYPSDEFAELRPRITWDRDRPARIDARDGAKRVADRQRRHDSRSRPLRRLPRGRGRAPPRRRARRRDGVREPRRRNLRPRRLDVAHRRDHARPRARVARAGTAGQNAVLARRPRRAAARARPCDRRA